MTPLPPQLVETFEQTTVSARQGDEAAGGRRLQACWPLLLRLVRQKKELFLKRDLSGSDVIQEAILKTMMALDAFAGETQEKLEDWLRVIVERAVIYLWRRSHTKKRDGGRQTSLDADDFEEPLRNAAPSAQEEAAKNESVRRVRSLLSQLPVDYGQVLMLRAAGSPFQEIGLDMDRTTDAARRLYGRALDALKKLVDDQE